MPFTSIVDLPARLPSRLYDGTAGGGTWSNKPSFSSKVRKKAVLLQVSGLDVRGCSTCSTKEPPCAALDGAPGCSDSNWLGKTQLTAGKVPLRTSLARSSRDQL